MGRSIRAIWGRFGTSLHAQEVGDKLLEGVPPDALRRRDEQVKALLALPPVLAETGVVAGFEAQTIPPFSAMLGRLAQLAKGESGGMEAALPYLQFTAVFPGAKNHPEVVTFLDKLAAFADEAGIKQTTVAGRSCRVQPGGAAEWRWAWWLEGKHLVVVGALGDPLPGVNRVIESGAGVTSRPLYKAVKASPGFTTTTRGFIGAKAVTAILRRYVPPLTVAALEDAGLLDVEAVRIREGFEGDASRPSGRWISILGKGGFLASCSRNRST